MATKRTYMSMSGRVVTVKANAAYMSSGGNVISTQDLTVASGGRIMSSLTANGGLAGLGGIAGTGGGLAG